MKQVSQILVPFVVLGLLAGVGFAAEGDYRVGVDDVLTISVLDNKDLDQTVFVRPDGRISLTLLGEVDVRGLTVAELARKLSEMYSKQVKGAEVTVGVREIRSRAVFFVGGVVRVGPLQLTQDLTLLQAISLVGGLAPGADLESAFVLRGSRLIPVDFVRLIQKRDLSQNIVLQPADTIVVPVADVVYVQGEVKTPGPVRFGKDLTVLKAIVQAGGFTNLAASRRVNLIRATGEKKERIEVNLDEIMRNSTPDIALGPNDIIIVPQRLF